MMEKYVVYRQKKEQKQKEKWLETILTFNSSSSKCEISYIDNNFITQSTDYDFSSILQ